MNDHLREREITAAAAGLPLSPPAAEHLRECLACRRRAAVLEEPVAVERRRRASAEPDWAAQGAGIMARVSAPAVVPLPRRPLLRPLLAAAAVLLVGFGLALQLLRPEPGTVAGRPVEEVLAEVDATLASDTVPGFEVLGGLVPDAEEMASLIERQRQRGQDGGSS